MLKKPRKRKRIPDIWIEMRYKEDPDTPENWVDVSEEDALEKLEGNLWYNKGTVIPLLKKGKLVETSYSIYRRKVDG